MPYKSSLSKSIFIWSLPVSNFIHLHLVLNMGQCFISNSCTFYILFILLNICASGDVCLKLDFFFKFCNKIISLVSAVLFYFEWKKLHLGIHQLQTVHHVFRAYKRNFYISGSLEKTVACLVSGTQECIGRVWNLHVEAVVKSCAWTSLRELIVCVYDSVMLLQSLCGKYSVTQSCVCPDRPALNCTG